MKLVNSGFVSGKACSNLNGYDRLRNRIKILQTAVYVLHEQRVYGTHDSGAERKLVNSFLLIKSEGSREKESRVGKVLLLFLRDVEEENRAMIWPLYSSWNAYLL